MGRYLNPSDQGERLHDLLQIVPSRPKTVNARTKKAAHRRLRPEQVEELVIGYKRGQPSTSWPSSSGSTGRQCPGSWREKAYLAADVPYLSPAQIEQATRLYATGLSLVSVGKQLGCDGSTVHLALRKAAVRMRDIHGRGGYTAPFGAQSTVAKVVIMRRFSACSPCCQVRLEAFTAWSCENRRSALVAT